MTDYQDALVLENLDLVNWVIRTRISIPNRPLLTYDDFYAIGCEAICRAALKYQPDMGAFAPFACRYIYNAIVDHCRAMNYRLERSVEISEDENASLLDMRLGKLQPVSIPEFSIWSMLLWDVLTHDELRKKYFEKMEEVKLDPSGFEKALEMLVKRKLIIKGVGYTGADALYNMLYDTYVIPLRGVQGTQRLLNIAKLLKQGKVNFFEAVYLLQPDQGTEAEQRIMKLVTQTPLSVPELVRCFENDVRDVSSADKVISAIYTEESDNQARLNNACSLSNHRQDVLEATTNLYLTRQVILEHA